MLKSVMDSTRLINYRVSLDSNPVCCELNGRRKGFEVIGKFGEG